MNEHEIMSADDLYLAPEEANKTDEVALPDAPVAEAPKMPPVADRRDKPQKIKRMEEIPEQRGSNMKVYRLSDGTEQAVFSPYPIHVFDDETHTFQDVENVLTEDADGKHFRCGKNRFVAKFSREEDNDEIFSIEQGAYKITVCAKKKARSKRGGMKPQLRRHSEENTPDILTFPGAVADTDYEYSVENNGVKENIVVKHLAASYRYPFVLRCEQVHAQFDKHAGRVAFVSNENDEEIFFIPAPFMQDANGVTSTAVHFNVRQTDSETVSLTVDADAGWMNDPARAFPVTIDPQIMLPGNSTMDTYSWKNGELSANEVEHTIGTIAANNGTVSCLTASRMYLRFAMPTLPRNPRIKKAELRVFQCESYFETETPPLLGLYQATGEFCAGACTPIDDINLIDYARMEYGVDETHTSSVNYTFDITTLIDKINKNESYYPQLVLKLLDESITSQNNITLYGSASCDCHAPEIIITYESSYGVNTSYRTHTHELGRFGQGSVDLQCGNLMFESEDFAWPGSRMPITIKHFFNSALAGYAYTNNAAIRLTTADFSAMKLGHGFRLNLMQSMVAASFVHDGTSYSGYVFIGENGEETYFKKSEKQDNNNSQSYYLYEDVNDKDVLYDPRKRMLRQGDNRYWFDTTGRLTQINDATGNRMLITYENDRITSVTDGAGRQFCFTYDYSRLRSIEAPDSTKIQYTYSIVDSATLLTGITYPNGQKAVIAYTGKKPSSVTLKDAAGNRLYRVVYSFSGDRLISVAEYGDTNTVIGAKSTYSYSAASAKTVVTTTEPKDENGGGTANVIKTTYAFDSDGNVVGQYAYSTDTGNVGISGEESGIHPLSGSGGAGIVSNINNLLENHNFESLSGWSAMPGNCGDFYTNLTDKKGDAKYGWVVLYLQSDCANCGDRGVYQVTNSLPKGQYTFSAYLRILSTLSGNDAGAFLRVTDTTGRVLGESEHLTKADSEYARLIVPFELTSARCVQVQIIMRGQGKALVDATQLENNPYANAYNMVKNGSFERGTSDWFCSSGVYSVTDTRFSMSRSLCMAGSVESDRYACQSILIKTAPSLRETFTLSGWAKGYGLPNHDRKDVANTPTFRLRAVILYRTNGPVDPEKEEFTADFSPCTEEWQFASIRFSKSKNKSVGQIKLYCEYGYNSGVAYFDNIQLVRNSLEPFVPESDMEIADTWDDTSTESTTTADVAVFREAKDNYGNTLTETTFTDGEFGSIYRAFEFGNNYNDMVKETDARGNQTGYTVNAATSRNTEVTDRLGNRTAYEYDTAGRTTRVASKNAAGATLASVSYAYDTFDNMTGITRGDGMSYTLAYDHFRNLASIGILNREKPLIQYTYKNGSGRLKQMTYANGHTMKAIYNSIGQMVAEKWFATKEQAETTSATPFAYYRYTYDGSGNIVRSLDIPAKKEYTYEYEESRIIRSTEADVTLSGDMVIARTIACSVRYSYDTEDKLTRKVITFADGSSRTTYYETKDNATIVKFSAGGRTVTSHSKTDSFGRKVFDELQLGTGFVSRQFVYHAGKVTDTHKSKAKVKSSATTQLVKQIILSDGTALSYGYDDEERIISVTETTASDNTSVTKTTTYTYDALGQLLTEKVNGVVVNSMEYDCYGNITKKNGVVYHYGDTAWKDLLTAYGDQASAYDDQGNPTTYRGHTLTWEKGRQLKSFDNNTYTYNANGIRTSKTVDGVLHTYTLDGTKILRETWAGNTLVPLYDNEDTICGILYNGIPYYFLRNLQGDVIAILDRNAQKVATYSYDAWGAITAMTDTTSVGIATINPFRYRGYYYDGENFLYYLQSRYYDPVVGRFINADEVVFVACNAERAASHNLFTYADNSPAINVDENGFYAVATYAVSSALYAQMAAMSAAATSLVASIKAFVAMIWNIFVVVSLLLIAIAAVVYLCKTIENIHSSV